MKHFFRKWRSSDGGSRGHNANVPRFVRGRVL
jgi:hypothetical protein